MVSMVVEKLMGGMILHHLVQLKKYAQINILDIVVKLVHPNKS